MLIKDVMDLTQELEVPGTKSSETVVNTILDIYQAAWLLHRGFEMKLTMSGNRVAFTFTDDKKALNATLDEYFGKSGLQGFIGHLRNLKIALHDKLRREGS